MCCQHVLHIQLIGVFLVSPVSSAQVMVIGKPPRTSQDFVLYSACLIHYESDVCGAQVMSTVCLHPGSSEELQIVHSIVSRNYAVLVVGPLLSGADMAFCYERIWPPESSVEINEVARTHHAAC